MAVYAGPDIVEDGLVLCLDAANPRSYPGSGTTWFDISGRGNHFTLYNSPTFTNNTFSLDGTNDYFRSTNTINFSFTNVVTIQYIFRPKTFVVGSSVKVLFELSSNYNYNSDSFLHYYFDNSAGNIVTAMMTAGGNYNFSIWDSSLFGNTSWKFCNPIFNRNIPTAGVNSHSQTFFYTQAIQRSPNTLSVGSQHSNNFINDHLYIASRGGVSFFADIELSYFSIYSKALNASEITQNYNALRGRFNI